MGNSQPVQEKLLDVVNERCPGGMLRTAEDMQIGCTSVRMWMLQEVLVPNPAVGPKANDSEYVVSFMLVEEGFTCLS